MESPKNTRAEDIAEASIEIACAYGAEALEKALARLHDRAFVAGVNFSEQHYRYRPAGDER